LKALALIVVLLTGSLLLSVVSVFPAWADPHSPANSSRISQFYITENEKLTGVPNLVTAVLADYRGFDTLFETVVIFTAGIAVFAVLGRSPRKRRRIESQVVDDDHDQNMIVIQSCRLIIPIMQLFALYVIAHGHHSPGGGFQGGVILGSSFILWAIARNLPTALDRLSSRKTVVLACTGILIYAGVGLVCQGLGSNFLDYHILHTILPSTDRVMARSHAMLGVEIGVAFTVASVMFGLYACLSSQGREEGGL
jgi:multicomponent Na+:H+ antiporter subunit B